MPGHVKLGKKGEPDPDPMPIIWIGKAIVVRHRLVINQMITFLEKLETLLSLLLLVSPVSKGRAVFFVVTSTFV